MKTLAPEQLDWLIRMLRAFGDHFPAVTTLIVMIGLDIISGWIVAIAKRTLNSTVSWTGIMRKTMVLLLVAMAMVIEPYAQGVPLAMLVSVGFIAQEGLSILENAGALGLPLPDALVDVLAKLQKGRKERMNQKMANTTAVNLNTAALQARIDQEQGKMAAPPAVSLAEPVKVEIINPPEHPANVVISQPENPPNP